ncbi:MAG: DUF423 domain-containing protein [Calditrichia bacterium]
MNKSLITGAIGNLLFVMGGAFGAHGLKNVLTETQLDNYHTALFYLMVHSMALLFLGLFQIITKRPTDLVYWFWSMGVLFFSGSLILFTFSGSKFLIYITPIGGTLMILGWFFLIIRLIKYRI